MQHWTDHPRRERLVRLICRKYVNRENPWWGNRKFCLDQLSLQNDNQMLTQGVRLPYSWPPCICKMKCKLVTCTRWAGETKNHWIDIDVFAAFVHLLHIVHQMIKYHVSSTPMFVLDCCCWLWQLRLLFCLMLPINIERAVLHLPGVWRNKHSFPLTGYNEVAVSLGMTNNSTTLHFEW